MTEEFFYHYTSKKVAKSIIRKGKILPVSDSIEANGDVLHGEGVYLTTLEPGHGEEIIKHNKWGGVAATKTTIEVFFEIVIPSSNVVRANDTRDIQVHKGPLQLSNYKWSLKNWDGQLLATQFFMVSSDGGAKAHHSLCMGRYSIVRDIVMKQEGETTFVYKKDEGERSKYLYNSDGNWVVGNVAGDTRCSLGQTNYGPKIYSPSKTKKWRYYHHGGWHVDKTLKVFPCYQ